MVDCSRSYGNQGCNGGLYDYAFDYAYYYNLEDETDYPYKAQDLSCRYSKSYGQVYATKYRNVKPDSKDNIKRALQDGPVSVSVQANQDSFMHYTGGILTANACPGSRLDHAILAVGWDTDAFGEDYLIVKNSWGTSWGEKGYIRMQIGDGYYGSACGVLDDDTIPYTDLALMQFLISIV